MSKYWSHYSQSAKWSRWSRTQACTVVFSAKSNIWPNPCLGPAFAPAGALLSAVQISMCGSAMGSGFSELLLGEVRPSWRRVREGSWIWESLSGFPGPPTGWLTPGMVRRYLSLHVPHPHLQICHQTACTRLHEVPLLTSSADKQLRGVERRTEEQRLEIE